MTIPLPQHQADEDGLRQIDPVRDVPRLASPTAPPVDGTSWSAPPERVNCEYCEGVGWLRTDAPVGHPDFGRLIPCACTTAARSRRLAAELTQLSNLAAFRDKTFATFSPFVSGLRDVVPQVLAYAHQPDGWLTLLGSYGVGKTHLAAAIAHEVLGRDELALFVVAPDMLDHLRATFAPQSAVTYDERFERFRSVPLLLIDDLGTESATSWAREKLYQLLNHRYNLRLATVITSNLKPSELDPRIYSRMCDPSVGRIITITATDYRRRPEGHT
jgi:DNA replication protein DnaC